MQFSPEEAKYLKDLLRIDYVSAEAQRQALTYQPSKDTEAVDKHLRNRQYMADKISNRISNNQS